MVYTQQRKKILDSLVEEINKFDCYFEMSDSTIKYSIGYANKIKIIAKLKECVPPEKKHILERLNEFGKLSWERYFK